MPAVVRIDTGGTHGYQARIGGSVGYESKLFSDKKCGGKRKAKAAAIAWLEERGDRYAPRRFGPKKGIQVNNVSGTPGVHQSQLTRNGNVSRYWAAHYSIGPNGRRTHRSKRFYFGKRRSEEEARALAEEFRTGWVDAFESDGVNGVKAFFKEWDEKYPGRNTGRKKTRKTTSTKKTTAKAADRTPKQRASTAKKPASGKPAAKKPAAKKSSSTGASSTKATSTKASGAKAAKDKASGTTRKPAAKKSSTASKKAPADKKPAPAKSSAKKPAAKETTTKKSAPAKKPAAKKPAAKKSSSKGAKK